jgi:hypothetical protein
VILFFNKEYHFAARQLRLQLVTCTSEDTHAQAFACQRFSHTAHGCHPFVARGDRLLRFSGHLQVCSQTRADNTSTGVCFGLTTLCMVSVARSPAAALLGGSVFADPPRLLVE